MVNLGFAALVMAGSGFRSGFGASTDVNSFLLIGLVIIQILSLVVRYSLKMQTVSLVVVALPMLGIFFWFVWEKIQGKA